MRLRDIIVWSVCIVLAAVLLITAGMRLDYINSQRYQMKLISNEPLKNAPPSLAFATVAMGAFRGLVVDILWMRAETLKEQGQFFDAKQLAEWITTLQPRFAAVWEFQAWNMAYNISVAIPATEPEQRWRWVKNGYELLRDEGIPLNPKSITLYRELARIFQHKIGDIADDAHRYYKLQLATAMESLLGVSPDNEYFKTLAEAPVDWRQIIKDTDVAGLIAALKAADSVFADDNKLVSNYLSLRQNPARFSHAAFKTIDSYRGTKGLEKFDIFARAYQLRNTWKLEPALMCELNNTYGPVDWGDPNKHLPLDWRHPDTHAIYWAVKGLKVAGKKEYSADEANTDRIVNHGLQNLFRNGKIFIYNMPPQEASDTSPQLPPMQTKGIYTRPDLRMFETYNKSALAVIDKYKYLEYEKTGTFNSMKIGYRNMLENAILLFYQAGLQRQAQNIYNQLRKLDPAGFKEPLIEFARKRLLGELKESFGINDVKEMIQGLLREGYFRYAMRDDDEATGREKMAKEVYDHYRATGPDEGRVDLPDFELLRYLALFDFLNDPQYPLNLRLSLRGRIKIERPELSEQLERQEEKILKESETHSPTGNGQ